MKALFSIAQIVLTIPCCLLCQTTGEPIPAMVPE
jgi:hypothetical protein